MKAETPLAYKDNPGFTYAVYRGNEFIGYARLSKEKPGKYYAAALYKQPDGSSKGRVGAHVNTKEEAGAELLEWLVGK